VSKSEKPIFFVDRALGKSVVSALREAGASVEAHADHFAPDAPDTEWLPVVSEKGWIVLTKDANLRRNPLEIRAIAEAEARVFILNSGNLSRQETIDIFVGALKRIKNFAQGNQPPFIARIDRRGHVSLWRNNRELMRPW
jgi:predicted nuclease of predicted toxin-antitoxin system